MAEPVTLIEARAHLRLDATSGTHPDDATVLGLIAAARAHVEGLTQLTLVTTTHDEVFDAFPTDADGFRLAHNPVASVTWVKYVAGDGTLTTLDSSVYRLDTGGQRARLALEYDQSWPSVRAVIGAVQIRTVCGAAVSPGLKLAILLLVAHWYDTRVPVGAASLAELPHAVAALVAPHRIVSPA